MPIPHRWIGWALLGEILLLEGCVATAGHSIFALTSDSILDTLEASAIIGSVLCFILAITHFVLPCCIPLAQPILSGTMLGGLIALIICVNTHPLLSATQANIYLAVICASGVIGGVVGLASRRFGVVAAGVVGGYCVGVLILDAGLLDYMGGRWGPVLFLVLFTGIGTVLAIFHATHRYAIGVGLAAAGSCLLVCGVDFYLGAGFRVSLTRFVERSAPKHSGVEISVKVLAVLALSITLGVSLVLLMCPCAFSPLAMKEQRRLERRRKDLVEAQTRAWMDLERGNREALAVATAQAVAVAKM